MSFTITMIFGPDPSCIRGVGGSGIDSSQFIAHEMDKVLKGGKSALSSARFEK
ncbi:MAG: hypothetical protein WCT03_22270 [Candidatus Obscuribacterales bacterium]